MIIVHTVSSMKDKLDQWLKTLKFSRKDYIKYVSFRSMSSNDRLGIVHMNICQNTKIKYDIIKDVSVTEFMTIDNIFIMVHDYLHEQIYNGKPLFVGVEQGAGMNIGNVFVMFYPHTM